MKQTLRVSVTALVVCSAQVALANGLEPPTTASARYSGSGAASASSVAGPDALLMNPAGLARTKRLEVTFNLMPVMNESSAPIYGPNQSMKSELQIAPLGELLLAYEVVDGFLAVGAGVNFAGGQGASYGGIDFGEYSMNPEVSQMLGALEASLGAAVAITDNLSFGATWRMTYQRGDIKSAGVLPNGALQAMSIKDASGLSFDGLRFGLQYRSSDDRFGAGVSVRTPVEWKLTGDASLAIATPQGVLPEMPLGEATLKLTYPLQAAFGVDAMVVDGLRLFAQYSFTDYSVNEMQEMQMGGMALDAKLSWLDRHTAQLGAEYALSSSWDVRAGYIFESRVVPSDRPSIYAPPSAAHTFALGAGVKVTSDLRFDVAALFNTSAGEATPAADAQAFAGEYSADNLVGSASVAYRF